MSPREARLQLCVLGAIGALRRKKGGKVKATDSAYWIGIGKTCRRECFD